MDDKTYRYPKNHTNTVAHLHTNTHKQAHTLSHAHTHTHTHAEQTFKRLQLSLFLYMCVCVCSCPKCCRSWTTSLLTVDLYSVDRALDSQIDQSCRIVTDQDKNMIPINTSFTCTASSLSLLAVSSYLL